MNTTIQIVFVVLTAPIWIVAGVLLLYAAAFVLLGPWLLIYDFWRETEFFEEIFGDGARYSRPRRGRGRQTSAPELPATYPKPRAVGQSKEVW